MLNQRGVERIEKRKNGNEYTCRYNRFIHCPSACGASTSDSTKDDMLLDEASRSYLSASIHCIQISRDQSPSITSVPIRQRGKSCDREESQYAWTNFEIPAWVRNKASICKTSWFLCKPIRHSQFIVFPRSSSDIKHSCTEMQCVGCTTIVPRILFGETLSISQECRRNTSIDVDGMSMLTFDPLTVVYAHRWACEYSNGGDHDDFL